MLTNKNDNNAQRQQHNVKFEDNNDITNQTGSQQNEHNGNAQKNSNMVGVGAKLKSRNTTNLSKKLRSTTGSDQDEDIKRNDLSFEEKRFIYHTVNAGNAKAEASTFSAGAQTQNGFDDDFANWDVFKSTASDELFGDVAENERNQNAQRGISPTYKGQISLKELQALVANSKYSNTQGNQSPVSNPAASQSPNGSDDGISVSMSRSGSVNSVVSSDSSFVSARNDLDNDSDSVDNMSTSSSWGYVNNLRPLSMQWNKGIDSEFNADEQPQKAQGWFNKQTEVLKATLAKAVGADPNKPFSEWSRKQKTHASGIVGGVTIIGIAIGTLIAGPTLGLLGLFALGYVTFSLVVGSYQFAGWSIGKVNKAAGWAADRTMDGLKDLKSDISRITGHAGAAIHRLATETDYVEKLDNLTDDQKALRNSVIDKFNTEFKDASREDKKEAAKELQKAVVGILEVKIVNAEKDKKAAGEEVKKASKDLKEAINQLNKAKKNAQQSQNSAELSEKVSKAKERVTEKVSLHEEATESYEALIQERKVFAGFEASSLFSGEYKKLTPKQRYFATSILAEHSEDIVNSVGEIKREISDGKMLPHNAAKANESDQSVDSASQPKEKRGIFGKFFRPKSKTEPVSPTLDTDLGMSSATSETSLSEASRSRSNSFSIDPTMPALVANTLQRTNSVISNSRNSTSDDSGISSPDGSPKRMNDSSSSRYETAFTASPQILVDVRANLKKTDNLKKLVDGEKPKTQVTVGDQSVVHHHANIDGQTVQVTASAAMM